MQIITIRKLEASGEISPQEAYHKLEILLTESPCQLDIWFVCSILHWDLQQIKLSEEN